MVRCANRVIKMGEQSGYEYLRRYSIRRNMFESDQERDERVALLCRLVYGSKDGTTLRGPVFGTPDLPAAFVSTDVWPDMPLVLSRGVPFLLASDYCLAGPRETGAMYLEYCHRHGLFRKDPHVSPTREEQEKAVQDLLDSQRWRDSWTGARETFGVNEEAVRQRLQQQVR